MTDTKWLIDFYGSIAKAANQDNACVVKNFEYTFQFVDIQNTFPTIEDTGYSKNKTKQLTRNYWNETLDGYITQQLEDQVSDFIFVPNGIRKATSDSTHGDFCLSKVDVSINNGIVDVIMITRASEVFQVILADLYFFNSKLQQLTKPFNLKMGTLKFKIGESTLGVFALRTYTQLKIVANRTPDEREKYFNEFFDVIYANNPDLALRMTTRFLSYYLVDVNPTPTYAKLKMGHKTAHSLLEKAHRVRIGDKMRTTFPVELLALQNKRKTRNQTKFYDLV